MNLLFPYLARWRSANWSRYHQLLSALCRQGHRVYVLEAPPRPDSGETNYTDAAVSLPEGMTVREIAAPLWQVSFPLEKLAKKGLVTLATRRLVRQAIDEHKIDVLLLYNFPQLVLASVARGRCKVVFDVADDLLAMFAVEAGRWAPLLKPLATWFFNRLARTSDLVTTSSQIMAPHLPGCVRILPNGADLAAASRASGDAIRARYAPPIVGFIGAFEYCVDFRLIIEAAALLPQVTFLLVGTGRQWGAVQQEVQRRGLDNVVLTGAVPYPRSLDYVKAMDICLVPRVPGPISDHAAPLKLFEYASLQKPIIATPARGMEVIAGDLVNVARNGQEAAALIQRILAEPAPFLEQAKEGLERIRTTYNWDRIAEQFVAMLEAL